MEDTWHLEAIIMDFHRFMRLSLLKLILLVIWNGYKHTMIITEAMGSLQATVVI